MSKGEAKIEDVREATDQDRREIGEWLRLEQGDGDRGFYENFKILCSLDDYRPDIWVIRYNDHPVAFQAPGIMAVRSAFQYQGYGTLLVDAWKMRSLQDEKTNVLTVQCSPEDSLGFWQRMGFDPFIDEKPISTFSSSLHAQLVLERLFPLPDNLPEFDVTVSFYAELALYEPDRAFTPIGLHHVKGAQLDNRSVQLKRRIVGVEREEPDGKKLAVKIDVNGVQRVFSRADHSEARAVGVDHNPHDGSFYIDQVKSSAL